MFRHPFAGLALGLGDLVGGHLASGYIRVYLRVIVALVRRKDEPHVRMHEIQW